MLNECVDDDDFTTKQEKHNMSLVEENKIKQTFISYIRLKKSACKCHFNNLRTKINNSFVVNKNYL